MDNSSQLFTGNYSTELMNSFENLTFNCPANIPFLDTSQLVPDDARYQELLNRLQFITGLICYPIFCVLGLTGNMISLIVLSHRKMKSSTNTYLQALAISDSIKLLNDSFYFLTILFMHIDPPTGQQMYGYLYPYAHYFFNMSVCITAWLTVGVAAER